MVSSSLLILFVLFPHIVSSILQTMNTSSRSLLSKNKFCEKIPESYDRYLENLQHLFNEENDQTCVSEHLKCGWPAEKSDLPLYVFVVGIEGTGHHLWNVILKGVLDCTWV